MYRLPKPTWLLIVMCSFLLAGVALARPPWTKPPKPHKACVLKTTKKARSSRSRRGALQCTRKPTRGGHAGIGPAKGGAGGPPAPEAASTPEISTPRHEAIESGPPGEGD